MKTFRFRIRVRGHVFIVYPFWWRWEPEQFNYGFIAWPTKPVCHCDDIWVCDIHGGPEVSN